MNFTIRKHDSASRDLGAPTSAASAAANPPAWRAILIGSLLIPISVYFGNYAYVVVQALLWGQTSILRGPVIVLFTLALVNLLLRRMGRSAGLQASEMLIIYSMIAVSSCVSGFGMIQWLVNMLPALQHYTTPANHYDQFAHYIAPYLTPQNPDVIENFFRGGVSMYQPAILADWAAPVAIWSVFVLAMSWVTLCLCAVVRKQWIEGERINFPLVYLPIEMAKGASGEGSLYSNRLMWIGFALAGILESINYINYLYPSMPYIQLKPVHWEPFLTSRPWNTVGSLTTAFYPFAIGIAYLLSVEVSFSCWFFYLLTKVEYVLSSSLGLSEGMSHNGMALPPYIGEQGVGAFLALAIILVCRSKDTIWAAIRCAWDRKAEAGCEDGASPLSPRVAVWGGLLGIAALTAFVTQIGIPLWAALAFWVIYFLFLIVLTRVVSEAGAGWAWGPMVPVHSTLFDAAGMTGFSHKSLSVFGYLSWFDTEYRDSPMPHELAAMKMGQESNTRPNRLLWALLIATVLGIVSAWWAYLHIYYEFGAGTAKVRPALMTVGPGMLSHINGWLQAPTAPDHRALYAMAGGAVVMVILSVARQTFVWWPFHPVGYALAGTYSMEYMWCPFLAGWLIKSLVLRYGGVRLCLNWMPFFLGLILGDYVVPTLWGFWGTATNTQVYMAFPH
ncbi:MAG: hypothetical protein P4L33_11755 [Capsulimonadaceae bacterium]|nr:hypothetical protein [Capsulimonadaceae bacterium]